MMTKQELQTAASIGLLYLIRMLGLFTVLPVLPLSGRELTHATPALIGLALGVYGLSQAILQIPMGLLSDKFGRKQVIFLGLVLFVLGSLLAGFTDSIYGVIAGRLLQGCGAIASSLLALMSDLVRVDQRSKAMAIIGISIGSSFGLALVIGPLIHNYYGLQGVFLFAAFAGLIGMLVLVFVIPKPLRSTQNLDSALKTDRIKSILMDAGIMRVNLGIFMAHYLLMASFVAFPLIFESTGQIPVDQHHIYYFVMLLFSFILMTPFMWLSDKADYSKPMLLASIFICMVSLAILGESSGYYFVIAGMTLFFMAFNLLEVMLPSRVAKMAHAGSRGTAMGVYASFQFAGIFAGGLVGGLILSASDISTLMLANAAVCLLWLLLSFGLPDLGDIASKIYSYDDSQKLPANKILEQLSSLHGVLEVVLIEDQKTAYLKVDKKLFDDSQLAMIGH